MNTDLLISSGLMVMHIRHIIVQITRIAELGLKEIRFENHIFVMNHGVWAI